MARNKPEPAAQAAPADTTVTAPYNPDTDPRIQAKRAAQGKLAATPAPVPVPAAADQSDAV